MEISLPDLSTDGHRFESFLCFFFIVCSRICVTYCYCHYYHHHHYCIGIVACFSCGIYYYNRNSVCISLMNVMLKWLFGKLYIQVLGWLIWLRFLWFPSDPTGRIVSYIRSQCLHDHFLPSPSQLLTNHLMSQHT